MSRSTEHVASIYFVSSNPLEARLAAHLKNLKERVGGDTKSYVMSPAADYYDPITIGEIVEPILELSESLLHLKNEYPRPLTWGYLHKPSKRGISEKQGLTQHT